MNISKKRIVTFIAALVVSAGAMTSTLCVGAQSTTPVGGGGTVTIEQPQRSEQPQAETNTTTENSVPVPTAVATQQETNVVEVGETKKATEKKYSSKGFVILWFFLGVLVNVVLSFMIANRFYKMSKRENHINAEIRALRRDLEEKFISTVDGFAEMETDVTNTNENYSENGSIDLGEMHKDSYSKDSDDVFRQWESKMAKRNAKTSQEDVSEEIEEIVEEEPKRTRKYSPSREDYATDAEVEVAFEEETKSESIKDKAMGIINTIFPFKD